MNKIKFLMQIAAQDSHWLRMLWHAAGFVKHELFNAQPVPILQRLNLLRHGFWSESQIIYDLANNDRHMYLSDWIHISRNQYLNGMDGLLLYNKLWFHQIMQPFDKYLPDIYGILRHGQFHSISEVNGDSVIFPRDPTDAVSRLLKLHKRLFLKPISGGEGKGVVMLAVKADQYEKDSYRITESALNKYVASLDDFLVQEFIEQDPFPSSIFPDSPNTMRIMTMWDDENREPFIAAACHRFGRAASVPVDNMCRGGISSSINLDSGMIGPASVTKLRSAQPIWYDRHPDTDASIHGQVVPRWHEVKQLVLSVAAYLSFIPYIGWDVLLTSDPPGIKIIEANDRAGLPILQIHTPLLKDPRIRSFFTRRGVIK
jgi:hypothetical protein